MGLACSQIRLLTLTARKADCEYGISIDSMEKMALSREQTELTQEYRRKLSSKQIAYYANGKYGKMNYGYLMGYGADFTAITGGSKPLKEQNSMILADYKGQVIMSQSYADAITSVLGASAMDGYGRGGTFSVEKIPEILAKLVSGVSAEQFETVINNGKVSSETTVQGVQTITGNETGEKTVDTTDQTTAIIQSLVDFYYPIFSAAAANGWTTEYNQDMGLNDDYVSDALVSGTFQLESVNDEGNYDEGTSLTYFITAGLIQSRTDSDVREEITAWYDAEKARISEKEDYIDLDIQNLSTELEAIKTEIQSVQSLIDDATQSVFDWGGG